MLTDFSIIEGAYLHDILDQPRAMEQTLTGLEISKNLRQVVTRLQKGKFRNIVLTGMGSSFHALHPINLELVSQGFGTMMLETSELGHYYKRLFAPNTLIVAVSQSGQSAEILRLLQSNRGRARIVGITNTPGSPLAKRSDATVLTDAGAEFSVSCKTYLASLLALRWLADAFCERDLQKTRRALKGASPAVQTYLSGWKDHVQNLAERLGDVPHLFLVGRGASLAAVNTGALIVKEAAHVHAEGMSSAAFRHGPLEMLGNEVFVLVFGGERITRGLNRTLYEDIREQQAQVEWIAEDGNFSPCVLPDASESFRAMLEVLPVQMITLALAAQVGREPGHFDRCSKVTTKE